VLRLDYLLVCHSQLNLPDFQRKDFTDLMMIGQGSFGKVYRGRKNGYDFVIKELADKIQARKKYGCS
jgi:hypothetical protein